MPVVETWRLLPFDVGPSHRHIALSDALTREGTSPTVWWHAADQTTLILGASQTLQPDLVARADDHGVRVAKRHAGGTSVLATTDVLGLDVLLPRGHRLASTDVVEGYEWLGSVWCAALRAMGANAHVVSIAEARSAPLAAEPFESLLRGACFGTVSPFEVTVKDRKVVGLAQVRRARSILLQAGVHLTLDATTLKALVSPDSDADITHHLRERAAGLDEVLPGKPEPQAVMAAFAQSLATRFGIVLAAGTWTESEVEYAERSIAEPV